MRITVWLARRDLRSQDGGKQQRGISRVLAANGEFYPAVAADVERIATESIGRTADLAMECVALFSNLRETAPKIVQFLKDWPDTMEIYHALDRRRSAGNAIPGEIVDELRHIAASNESISARAFARQLFSGDAILALGDSNYSDNRVAALQEEARRRLETDATRSFWAAVKRALGDDSQVCSCAIAELARCGDLLPFAHQEIPELEDRQLLRFAIHAPLLLDDSSRVALLKAVLERGDRQNILQSARTALLKLAGMENRSAADAAWRELLSRQRPKRELDEVEKAAGKMLLMRLARMRLDALALPESNQPGGGG
jgi:hypothetical protein